MRVAVAYFSDRKDLRLKSISLSLAEGIRKQGHDVEVIDLRKDRDRTLSSFSYIALGGNPMSLWGGRVSPEIRKYLSQAGTVLGKRSCAYISTWGIRRGKTLLDLMKIMETEGMLIKNSEILSAREEAFNLGIRLHINQE